MTVPSQAELKRKRAHLYQGPGQRQDTCRRCRYSVVTLEGRAKDKAFGCSVVGGEVAAGGCCAAWRPIAGPVIELRSVEYAQMAVRPPPKSSAERKARPAPTKRKPSGVGVAGAGHPWRRA